MRGLLLPIFLLGSLCIHSQEKNISIKDSLRKKLKQDSAYIFRRTFAKPFLKVENRFSFINSEAVNLLGFQVGATMLDRHTVAAGYYFPDPRKKNTIAVLNENINTNHYVELT